MILNPRKKWKFFPAGNLWSKFIGGNFFSPHFLPDLFRENSAWARESQQGRGERKKYFESFSFFTSAETFFSIPPLNKCYRCSSCMMYARNLSAADFFEREKSEFVVTKPINHLSVVVSSYVIAKSRVYIVQCPRSGMQQHLENNKSNKSLTFWMLESINKDCRFPSVCSPSNDL